MRSTLLSLALVSAGAFSALAQVLTRPTLGPSELPAAPLAPSEAALPASVEPIELLSVPVESGRLESLVPAERTMAHATVRPGSLARPESSRRLGSVAREIARPSAASPAPALGSLFDRASLQAPVVAGLGAA